MAAQTIALNPNITTDAGFRTIVQAIDAHFLACGWVAASDTGQINPTTVAKPGGANTAAGYRMYRTDDGLTNVFAKVEFGTGLASASLFGMWVTLSTSTNGAGTCSGNVTTRRQLTPAGAGAISSGSPNGLGEYTCVMAGGDGWISLAMFIDVDSATSCFVFHAERECDSDGAPVANKVATVWFSQNAWGDQALLLGLGDPAQPVSSALNCTSNAAATAYDPATSSYVTFDVKVNSPGPSNALRGIRGYHKTDIADEMQFTAATYGISQDWIALGHSMGTVMQRATGSSCVALRYE